MDENETPLGVSAHTGFPNAATDTNLGRLDLNHLLIQHSASTFLFRIRGNAWEDAGIFDDDIAIIDRALDAQANDLVICSDESGDDFTIVQHKKASGEITIWGVVTAVIHQFRSPAKPGRLKLPRES